MLSQSDNAETNSRKTKLKQSVCAECNELEVGKTDPSNETFYCVYCWKEFYGEDIGIDDVKKMKKEVIHIAPKRKHHKFWEMPGEEKNIVQKKETSKRKQKVPEADAPYYWFDKSSELLDLVNSLWDRDECGFILPIIMDFLFNEYVSFEVDAFADLGVRWAIREQISDHTGVLDQGVGLPVVRGYYSSSKSIALQCGIHVGFELVSIDKTPLQRDIFVCGDDMLCPTKIKFEISEHMKKHAIFSGRKIVSLCFRRTIPVPLDNEEYYVKKSKTTRSKFWKYESVADKYTYGSYYAVNSETYQYWEPKSICFLRGKFGNVPTQEQKYHTVQTFDSFDSSTIHYMTQARTLIKWRSTFRYSQNDGVHRTGLRYIPISFPCHSLQHWGVTIELGEEIEHWYVTTVTPDQHPTSIWRELGVLAGWQLKEIDGTKLTYENRMFFRDLLMEGRACTILFKAYVTENSRFW